MTEYSNEVEVKGLISKKMFNTLRLALAEQSSVKLVCTFEHQIDLFWDVGSPDTEAFLRKRCDTEGKETGWLIKVQHGTFNNRIEIDLPLGLASFMARPNDYAIMKTGSVWYVEDYDCDISLYYVQELNQHFLEIESRQRRMRDVVDCRNALGLNDRDKIEYVQKSLFSMIKTLRNGKEVK